VARFDAVLLDYGNTVVEFDRPQLQWIHVQMAEFLSDAVAPVDASTLGSVMDATCILPPLSEGMREFTPLEQMERILQKTYGRPFRTTDRVVIAADCRCQELFVASIEIDQSAAEAVRGLSRRVPVGLVSNYPCGDAVRRSLSSIGLADQFDPIVISGEVGFVKPHSKLFQVALEGLAIGAERVLFVGDDWNNDMVGAHAAGMATCQYLGHTSDLDLEQRYRSYRPDFSIHHLAELTEILTG
jgi:FMN phosphatase YigB (HAD superfamily)